MIRFVLSVISVNLYNDQTRCFVDRMGKYFSSLLVSWLLGVYDEAKTLPANNQQTISK